MRSGILKSLIVLAVFQISACGFFEESFNERALKFKENAEKNSKEYEVQFIAEIAGTDIFMVFDKKDTIGMGNSMRKESKLAGTTDCTETYIKSKDIEHVLTLKVDCLSSEQKKAVIR